MRRGIAGTFLTVLVLAGCISKPDPVPAPIALDPMTWLAPAPGGPLRLCQPVQPSLVREIPALAVPQAVAYLTDQSSMPLDAAQMKQMLPASDIDRLVIAETSAIDAEDEADRREAIAADPVLSNPAYRQAAQSQRIEAAVRRDAQPTLQPYLIRGLQARDAAGGYAVCRAGDALQVTHVSNLGGGTPELWFKPLVVLLPVPPGPVYVGTAAARS
jgi:hypothetical protein